MPELKHVVALSGGKDSTAMALRLKELYPSRVFEYVLTPTGDELPEMMQHWVLLSDILGPLKIITDDNLFSLIDREKMIPNYRARFCTRVLKIEPFIKYMAALSSDSIMYVGLRADEEGRLGVIDTQINIEYPMRTWGWGLEDVKRYLISKGVTIPDRTDCGCCFFQRLPEWRNLLLNYPARYEKYVQIEKKYGHTFRSPSRDTWPAALEDLRKEILSGRKMVNRKPRAAKKCRFCTL